MKYAHFKRDSDQAIKDLISQNASVLNARNMVLDTKSKQGIFIKVCSENVARVSIGPMHAITGNATLDLAVDKYRTVSPKAQCYKIYTGVYGPLPARTIGMILGMCILTSQGFIVYPESKDEDFKREIKIIAYVKTEGI